MNKKLIIGVIVVIILGFGGFKIWTDHKGGETKDATTSNLAKSKGESKGLEEGEKGENQLNNSENNSDISDTNTQQSVNVDSNSPNNDDKSTNSNNSSDSNILSSTNIKTPYNVSITGMRIAKIGGFSGTFVENGSNKKVSNILALEVKNSSKKDLQYGEIKLKINGKKTATFKLTNLPVGKTVTVMESTGSISYNSADDYKYEDATYAAVEQLPMSSNKIKVSTKGSSIAIKNISGKDLGTVYVYYKNTKGSSYIGGITYRAKFEGVEKDKSYTIETSHFSKANSEIVMIDTEK